MEVIEEPVPGLYYVNATGQLMSVRALVFTRGELTHVLVEYLDGRMARLATEEWNGQVIARYTECLGELQRDLGLGYEI
jgi:hypothetical protein